MQIVNGYACLEDNFHAKWIKEAGRLDHDQSIFNVLDKFIKPGDVALDLGAHIGTHTLWYSNRVGFEGKVICYEPNPHAFLCLKYNCMGLKNVELNNMAIGKKQGFVDVIDWPDNHGMAYTKEGKSIPLINIDSLKLEKLDFIKIDCEGAEPDILEGAKETIARCKPTMFIEINNYTLERNGYTQETVFEILRILGYSFRNIYETEKMDGVQYDIICQSL